MSWLPLTPEDLGYHLAPALTESDLLYIQNYSDWPNVFWTKLEVKVVMNLKEISVKFSSVADLNLFLFFHGSKEHLRLKEKSLGSLRKLKIPQITFYGSRSMSLWMPEVDFRWHRKILEKFACDFDFKVKLHTLKNNKKVRLFVFEEAFDLVRFLFSPESRDLEELKISAHKVSPEVKEDLTNKEEKEVSVMAKIMIEYIHFKLSRLDGEVKETQQVKAEVEAETKHIEKETEEVKIELEKLLSEQEMEDNVINMAERQQQLKEDLKKVELLDDCLRSGPRSGNTVEVNVSSEDEG